MENKYMLTKEILYQLEWIEHTETSRNHLNTIYFLNNYVLDVIPYKNKYEIRISPKSDYNNTLLRELFENKERLELKMKQLNIK